MTESTARAALFELQSSKSPFYTWEVPQKPVCVRIPFPVIDRLEHEAVESFRSLSSRGSEVGGLLFGTISPGEVSEVSIEDYELIACEYSRGPLYRLAEPDMARFDRSILQHGSSGSLGVIGMFRSHTRKGLSLDTDDLAFFDSRFRDPHHIALLIRPFATKASTAGIFIREGGTVHGETSYLEFPFRSSLLSPERHGGEGGEFKPAAPAASAPPPPPAAPRPTLRGQIVPIASRREVTPAMPAPSVEPASPARSTVEAGMGSVTARVVSPAASDPTPPAPQVEVKVAKQVVEEKIAKPVVEEKAAKPLVEEKTARPRVDEKLAKPTLEGKTAKPQVEEKLSKLQAEVKLAKPPLEDKTARPPVEEKTAQPKPEVKVGKPVVAEKAGKPQPEDKAAKPKPEAKEAKSLLQEKAAPATAPVVAATAVVERKIFSADVPEVEPASGRGKVLWIGVGVAVALILLVVFFVYPPLVHRNRPSGAPGQDSSQLSLRVERSGGEILLTWNRDADAIRSATQAVLYITDGEQHDKVDLDLAQLRNGVISYSPASGDVVFKMEVTGKGSEKTASESVRALRQRPSPLAGPEAAVPQAAAAAAKGAAPVNTPPVNVAANPAANAAANPINNGAVPAGPNGLPTVPEEAPKTPDRPLKPFQAPPLAQRLHPASPTDLPDAPSVGRVDSSSAPTVTGFNMNSVSTPIAPARPGTPPPAPSAPAEKKASGGQLQQAVLITKKDPEYPKLARETGAKGVVELEATIGTDGRVKSVKVVKGPPMLQKAASDAVMQWKYRPTMLNGVPVEAKTQVLVNFLGGER